MSSVDERFDMVSTEDCECGLCESFTPPEDTAMVIQMLVDDNLYEVKLCDECRRALCICGFCTAFEPGNDPKKTDGHCQAGPPVANEVDNNDFAGVEAEGRCRDGFAQREPYSLAEICAALGKDVLVAELQEALDGEDDEDEDDEDA